MSREDRAAYVDITSTPEGTCKRVCSASMTKRCFAQGLVVFSKLLRGASECEEPYAVSEQQYGWDYLNQVGSKGGKYCVLLQLCKVQGETWCSTLGLLG